MRNLINWLMTLWLMFTLVLPLLPLNKVLFFLIFLMYFIKLLLSNRTTFIKVYSPAIVLLIFTYGSFVSLVSASFDIELMKQFLLSTSILFYIYIIFDLGLDFNRMFIRAVKVLSVVSIVIFLESTIFNVGFISNVVEGYNTVTLHERDVGLGMLQYFRLSTVPVVFIALSYMLFIKEQSISKNRFWTLIFLTVILISLTRSLLITSTFVFLFSKFNYGSWKFKVLFLTIGTVSTFALLNSALLSTEESSNKTKIDDFHNFITHQSAYPMSNLVGSGVASMFYRKGKGFYSHTENTLLDSIRFFGIPLAIILYMAFIFPCRITWSKNAKYIFMVFLFYLLIAMTNPVLFTSFGYIVVLWYWYNILHECKYRNNKQTDQ